MSQPRGRTIRQRVWNTVRGPMQSQATKDAELNESVEYGDYNRVLKYLNRGANVTIRMLNRVLLRVYEGNYATRWFISDVKITRALLYKLPVDQRINYIDILHRGEKIIRSRTLEDAHVIAAAGGDNTINLVIESIIAAERAAAEEQVRLGRDPGDARSIFTREREDAIRGAATTRGLMAFHEGERAADEALHAAAAAEMAQRIREIDAQRDRPLEVHQATDKFREKIPRILELIKRDLGNPKEYSDIETIFKPIYTHIRTNSAFKTKKVGPNSVLRAQWETDLGKIKEAVKNSYGDKKVQMGLIVDFIIKHKEITECFITGFIYDCTHAYANGHLSCYAGIIERTVSTLLDCIKGTNEGVFGELHKIIEDNIKSWDELDKAMQGAYIVTWNDFLIKWSQKNAEVGDIKGMNPAERSEAVMVDFKKEENVPKYVEDHIRAELFPGLTEGVWSDYGFNSPAGLGGRRRKTKRHRKKSKRTRRR